jgi:uncharacterized membrane protein
MAKAVSWRVVATLTTIFIVLLLTGELEIAVTVGGLEAVTKLAGFYLHERLWQRIRWGLHPVVVGEAGTPGPARPLAGRDPQPASLRKRKS